MEASLQFLSDKYDELKGMYNKTKLENAELKKKQRRNYKKKWMQLNKKINT